MKEVMRVLVAEIDNEAIEDINKALNISFPGRELEITNSGKRCIDMIKIDGCLDVVILGFDLADISGFDVIEETRRYSELPIIVVSYIKDTPVVEQVLGMGVDQYINKPIHQPELISSFKDILREKENRVSSHQSRETHRRGERKPIAWWVR
jgi:DNA-binding response OmpR family regulator